MSKKSVKKMRRKIKSEILNIMNNKSALGGSHSFIGLVSSNGGKIRVRIPDLNIFEIYDTINDAVQNMQTKIEDKLYYEYYKLGKPIPIAKSANNFTPKRHETLKLFIARDPYYIKDRYEKHEDDEINIQDIVTEEEKNIIQTNCESAFVKESIKNKEIEKSNNKEDNSLSLNDKSKEEKVKVIDINNKDHTMYKHICANPKCNKEFYLTPSQEYNQRKYRQLNPNANSICCSKECAGEYRNLIHLSNGIKSTIKRNTEISDDAKDIMNMELYCANPECGKRIVIDKQRLSSIMYRIKKNPEEREHILSHLYCNKDCLHNHYIMKFKERYIEGNNNTENKDKNIEKITTFNLEPIIDILKKYGLTIDSVNISLKIDK